MTRRTLLTGWLYYDDDPAVSLLDKVHAAAAEYAAKYGRRPNFCEVHPAALLGYTGPLMTGGVTVRGEVCVMAHHLFVGVE